MRPSSRSIPVVDGQPFHPDGRKALGELRQFRSELAAAEVDRHRHAQLALRQRHALAIMLEG
jgi:hypothetical protein